MEITLLLNSIIYVYVNPVNSQWCIGPHPHHPRITSVVSVSLLFIGWSCWPNTQLVLDAEFSFNFLPTMARESSLLCYLIHSWGEKRWIQIWAKATATASVGFELYIQILFSNAHILRKIGLNQMFIVSLFQDGIRSI